MSKTEKVETFREQMRQSMAELRAIVDNKESFDGNGRYDVRTIEIADPSEYNAKKVKATREALNVSQTVFAHMVGVSAVLVRSWERGVRAPAMVARRLMDQMRANPAQFAALVRPIKISHGSRRVSKRTASANKQSSPRRRSA